MRDDAAAESTKDAELGGFFLVVLPFWFALRPHERAAAARECSLELQAAPAGGSSTGPTTR